MKPEHVQMLKALKDKFKGLKPKERENLSVCFLKVKLGVHNPDEYDLVVNFLDTFRMQINVENMDKMITYLHSESHTLPEFIAMEDSVAGLDEEPTGPELPIYNPDEVETVKEIERPRGK